MSVLRNLRSRQRLVSLYVLIVGGAAVVLLLVLPGQHYGICGMALAGMTAAWLIARAGSERLRRRLHELREATDAIGGGDLAQHFERLPNDDFIKLTESLERMVDQLRRIAEERDRLRQRLSRSEKLAVIGELAATVAHEINNPLDGLQNSTRIIRRNLDDRQQVRQLLDLMEAGLYRIETTVRRLLLMSRDEPINLEPTPVEEIVEDAVGFVQARLNRHGIELIRDFPPRPMLVQADAVHMAQVLINLMLNAADAMPNGGRLTLRCGTGCDVSKVLIEVIDTGAGIAEEHLPHVFEPFYSTKGKGGGTGLGLAVVSRIIEAHHGRISVASEVGSGTCFRIELPAATVAVATPVNAARLCSPGPFGAGGLSPAERPSASQPSSS